MPRWSPLFLTLSAVLAGNDVALAQPRVLDLRSMPDDQQISDLLWERSPDLVHLRARMAQAESEADRAHRLPNPTLDASWNTIPIGESNPPGMHSPLTNIPSYQIGLSEPFELGKREARQRSTADLSRSARFDAIEALRGLHLDLLLAIARVASSEQRIAWLADQVADAERLTLLASQRVTHGDAARLDENRARLDEAKLRNLLAAEHHHLGEALLECGRLAGVRCEPFASVEKTQTALAQLSRVPERAVLQAALAMRPDLQSLTAQEQGYAAAAELARARALPDPSIHLGYTFDQHQDAGNQRHSLMLGLSVPLPVFERGQADLAQALASRSAAEIARRLAREQAERDLDRLLSLATELARQQQVMRAEHLPLARSLVEQLTLAVRAGGTPLPDLLLARRNLNELLSDASELDLAVVENALSIRRESGALPLPLPHSLPLSTPL